MPLNSSTSSQSPVDMQSEILRLQRQHEQLDSKLEDFNGRAFLTPAEQVERKQLKKLKLQAKDRMSELNRMLLHLNEGSR